jgi:MurNAc alpha-1-phosphate uridylyltransferase
MKAMILAAGRGERMRPLTDSIPKPLLAVGGKPLIVWHLERLARAGLREIVINHSHLGERIVGALGDGSRYGCSIAWSAEAQALETAGGLATALPLLGEQPFLAINGDVYCEFDYAPLAARARALPASGRLAHLVLVPNPAHNARGDFALDGDSLRSEGEHRLTFAGIGAYLPEMLRGIRPGTKAALAPLLRAAMSQGRVGGELFAGRWEDVGTPRRLFELDAELRAGER